MESSLKYVSPVRPVAPYIGGKVKLAAQIIEMISLVDHEIYAEAFVGMGGIFFRRDKKPRAEIINDFSQDVANLFRILNIHFTPFVDMFRYQLTSRTEFQRLLKQDPDMLLR